MKKLDSLILHDILVQQEEKCDDFSSSPSTMLSFELSNGHLYDPRVPTMMDDDDQYVEYHLDDLTGVPSNAEEEQRVSQLVCYA